MHCWVSTQTAHPMSPAPGSVHPTGSQLVSGHAAVVEPAAQHAWVRGQHWRPQWCWSLGQSSLPNVASPAQQNSAGPVPWGVLHVPALAEHLPPPVSMQ
jgi:hypothetical protein